MGLFKTKEQKEQERILKEREAHLEDLKNELGGLEISVEAAIKMEDDYWLNELIDKAKAIHEQEPSLEIPEVITKAEQVMTDYGRRIENIKEKYTFAQFLELQNKAKEDAE